MTDTPNDWTDNDLEQLSRIAPSAGAPSDRAGKVREIVNGWIDANRYREVGMPTFAESGDALVRALERLLDAECKASVASALAEASALVISVSANHYGSWGSSPGINSDIVDAIRALSPSPNYIALREAEARIAEANKIFTEWAKRCGVKVEELYWVAPWIAALTEERDRIAKGTK